MTKEIRKEIVIVPAEAKIIEHVTHIYICVEIVIRMVHQVL